MSLAGGNVLQKICGNILMIPTNFSNNKRVYDCLIKSEKLPSLCLLCAEGELSKLGHIIPKFVMRWLKLASKKQNFYLNNTKEIVPDTIALKILCDNCEKNFSTHEKLFTDKYFKTYYRKELSPRMDNSIYFFALSVAWRILASTPIMKKYADSENYYNHLSGVIKSYLLNPNAAVEIDVYAFHADDIAVNVPDKLYNSNLLKFSVRQGIFCQSLNYSIDGADFLATLKPIPLVHFKLGVYYFIVTYQNHLQSLTFIREIKCTETGQVHVLGYSSELIGFLDYISNGDFSEVSKSVIPENIKYNIIS